MKTFALTLLNVIVYSLGLAQPSLKPIKLLFDSPTGLETSSDGKYAAIATNNGTVHLISLETNEDIAKGKASNVYEIGEIRLFFSPSGKYLVAGGPDLSSYTVFNVPDMSILKVHDYSGGVSCLAVDHDDKYIYWIETNDQSVIYQADMSKTNAKKNSIDIGLKADILTIHPKENSLLTVNENNIRIYNLSDRSVKNDIVSEIASLEIPAIKNSIDKFAYFTDDHGLSFSDNGDFIAFSKSNTKTSETAIFAINMTSKELFRKNVSGTSSALIFSQDRMNMIMANLNEKTPDHSGINVQSLKYDTEKYSYPFDPLRYSNPSKCFVSGISGTNDAVILIHNGTEYRGFVLKNWDQISEVKFDFSLGKVVPVQ